MFGQVAGHRKQGKPRMRWLVSIKEATDLWLEDVREAEQDRKKWRTLVEEKTRNRERTNVKWIQEKAMENHSCTAKLA
jgi:CRISPR/Cas system-associated endonuclease Cas1